MAPQGLNLIPNNKRIQYDVQFLASPKRTKKRKRKKKKANLLWEKSMKSIKKQTNYDSDVILIKSSENSGAPTENPKKDDEDDDDVIIINKAPEEIFISDSEEGENELDKLEDDVVILDNESKLANEKLNCDIIINISQPSDTNRIMENNLEEYCDENANNSAGPKRSCKTEENNVNASKKIKKTRLHQACEYPKSWTKDMIRYYSKPCEKNRNYDYVEILKNLKTKPSDWWINNADLSGRNKRNRGFFRCRKCGETGHIERECTRNVVCYMCGAYNHFFQNCPNKICLNCGRPTREYLTNCNYCHKLLKNKTPCELCGQISHEEILCPSKWRKHLVLDPSNASVVQQNPRKYCYNCAGKGHFGFECPYTSESEYPPENPLKTAFPNSNNNTSHLVIFLSKESADLLCTSDGNVFLTHFSEDTNTRVEICRGVRDYVKLLGDNNLGSNFQSKFQIWKNDLFEKTPNLIRL